MWLFTGVTAILAAITVLCDGQEIAVFPDTSQFVAINSTSNITFGCNVSVPAGNPMDTSAVWAINKRQIVSQSQMMLYETFGIFIQVVSPTEINITLNRQGSEIFDGSVSLECAASTPGPPPVILFSPSLTVGSYGRPDPPGPPRVLGSRPASLSWSRPANIKVGPEVIYNITAYSSSLNLFKTYEVVDVTQLSLRELENDALSGSEDCQEFIFTVVASLADVKDSDPVSSLDTIPLSTDVTPISSSLHVYSLAFNTAPNSITAGLFFKAAETCSANFPISNYTVLVDNGRIKTVDAPSGNTVRLPFTATLDLNRQFMVAIEACSAVICRTSNTTVLNTTDVQTAQVVFFENNIFLSCFFASGSAAYGCVFQFQVNQNGSGTEPEEFMVMRSGERGDQCNVSANQRNGYMGLSVWDLETDGRTRGQVTLTVQDSVLMTEEEYTLQTGCAVQREVRADRTAVAIAVPILVFVAIVIIITGSIIYYYIHYKQRKRKPRMVADAADGEGDVLILDIKSTLHDIISEPMPESVNVYETLRPNLSVQTDGSMKAERPPIEVELHEKKIRLKVNKTALKAVARFHSLVKHQPDDSIKPDDHVSLMALSQAPSRVHFKEDFSKMCTNLLPVKEVQNDEDGLRSWAHYHYTNAVPPSAVTPPASLTTTSPRTQTVDESTRNGITAPDSGSKL